MKWFVVVWLVSAPMTSKKVETFRGAKADCIIHVINLALKAKGTKWEIKRGKCIPA